MKRKTFPIFAITAFCLLASAGYVFSQEGAAPGEEAQARGEDEYQWVWGEVVSVNPRENEVLVSYVDYEADQEKQMTVSADENTKYENLGSISDIKPQDTISIDYVVSREGKNLAKNISLEKPETEPAPGDEPAPPEGLENTP